MKSVITMKNITIWLVTALASCTSAENLLAKRTGDHGTNSIAVENSEPSNIGVMHRFVSVNKFKLLQEIADLEAKYNIETIHDEPLTETKWSDMSEPMRATSPDGIRDFNYYGDVIVGSSRTQRFTAKFDTRSTVFFIPGPKCPSNQCVGPTRYNLGGINRHDNTTVRYQDKGLRVGDNYLDTVSIAGVRVEKTLVVSLTTRIGSHYSSPDSLMGLNFGRAKNRSNTFFEDAMEQGKVSAKEFSFYMGRTQLDTAVKSEITIGGRDPSKFKGSPALLPIANQDFWNVHLDGVVVNGKMISGTHGVATMDTGTTLMAGPANLVSKIYAAIPGAKLQDNKLYSIPCDLKPSFTFQLAGKQFPLKSIDIYYNKEGVCYGSLTPAAVKTFVLGDSFLKSWYSIFSYDADEGKPAVLLAEAV